MMAILSMCDTCTPVPRDVTTGAEYTNLLFWATGATTRTKFTCFCFRGFGFGLALRAGLAGRRPPSMFFNVEKRTGTIIFCRAKSEHKQSFWDGTGRKPETEKPQRSVPVKSMIGFTLLSSKVCDRGIRRYRDGMLVECGYDLAPLSGAKA